MGFRLKRQRKEPALFLVKFLFPRSSSFGIMVMVFLSIVFAVEPGVLQASDAEKDAYDLINMLKKQRDQGIKIDSTEIFSIFEIGSEYTDIQKSQFKKQFLGKAVHWKLRVYDVSKRGNVFQVTMDVGRPIGCLVNVIPLNQRDIDTLYKLKTGSYVTIAGVFEDITLRTVIVKPAFIEESLADLYDNKRGITQSPPTQPKNFKEDPKTGGAKAKSTFSGTLHYRSDFDKDSGDTPFYYIKFPSGQGRILFFCGTIDEPAKCSVFERAKNLLNRDVVVLGELKHSDPDDESVYDYIEVFDIR